MITDTYKWCSSRRSGIPNSGSVNFPGLNLRNVIDTEVNIPNTLNSASDYLNIDGGFYTQYARAYRDNTSTASSIALRTMGVVLGTGTTPPSASDRDIESYVADFTYVTSGWGAINQSDAIGTYNETIVTYRYTGASEVTISEVGIYMMVNINSSTQITVLIEHSLLATPKVMNTNDTITLSVKLYHTGAIALS